MTVDYFEYTNKGERPVNEDSIGSYINGDFSLFVLCDGLGGHGHGDMASKAAVEAMLSEAKTNNNYEDILQRCLTKANEAVIKCQKDNNGEMKTTACVLAIKGNNASFGHIGDSRIYYFNKGKYAMRSHDHSIPQMLCDAGKIKEKDIRHHEDRSRLLKCLPWDEDDYKTYEIDTPSLSLKSGDSFLLMSDGFWDWVDEKDMKKYLKKGKTSSDSVQLMAEKAFKDGTGNNMDNLSLIVIKLS